MGIGLVVMAVGVLVFRALSSSGGEPAGPSGSPLLPPLPPGSSSASPPLHSASPPAPTPPPAEPSPQLLPPPESGSWEATPLIARPRSIGRAGVEIEQGLQELQPRLAECFTPRVQPSYRGRSVREVSGSGAEDTGSTLVLLQLESRGGDLRIDDAPVEVRAGASEATLACIQDRLRGARLPVEAQLPAPRFRLRYAISP